MKKTILLCLLALGFFTNSEMAAQCNPDVTPPVAVCDADMTVPLPANGAATLLAQTFDDGSTDNCTAQADLQFFAEEGPVPSSAPPSTASVVFNAVGDYNVAMWVVDGAGNWNVCQVSVTVADCATPNVLACNDNIQVSLAPGLGADFTPDLILEGGPYCPSDGNYFAMQLDPPSTPMAVLPLTPADAGEHTVSVGLYEPDGTLISQCWGTVNVESWSLVKGRAFADTTADCIYDNEPNLAGQPVQGIGMVTGAVYEATTDVAGFYVLQVDVADTSVEVSLPIGFNYGGTCPTTYTANFPAVSGGIQVFDIPVQLSSDCPLLSVDIGAGFLRRCFDNVYEVNYCNLSDQSIDDISIEVTLDDYMGVIATSIPGTLMADNSWTFDIGTLAAGECGNFQIDFTLSCDAPLGLTHCVGAHILPDTICPQLANFSGANIEVGGYCEDELIYFTIRNTGAGPMAEPLPYIVVQDVIMMQGENFDLGPGDFFDLDPIPATASTYRLEAAQETNHPYGGVAAIAIEGCGENFTPGLVNFFPLNGPNPFHSTDCQPNIGAFDPNDKLAFPTGYGEEHLIEQGTDIEYVIRFQNTGTDTAFNVTILDTLSQFLDPVSIRPGAASHGFNFEILEGHILRFTFPNIMLPDSNANEALSHGFIKFRTSQMPGLAIGDRIENSAAIYFDFNAPIITGTVFHTIGEHFIEVLNNASERPDGLGELTVYPNPSFGDVTFELPADAPAEAIFTLHDQLGRTVSTAQFAGGKYRFERGSFSPGAYFYSVDIQGLGSYTGKLILY